MKIYHQTWYYKKKKLGQVRIWYDIPLQLEYITQTVHQQGFLFDW